MSLKKFTTDILNIEPNRVESIDSIESDKDTIELQITLSRDEFECKYCKGPITVHGYRQRKLIHSTFVNRKCIIIYRQRRYECKACEISYSENNPFANPKENVTIETKINVLKDLKYVTNTYSATAARYNLSTTKVQSIFDKHVDIERKTLPEVLSIDEHYSPETNYDSVYICILMDFNSGLIIDVLPDRKKNYLDSYLNNIKVAALNEKDKTSELDNVKYVSIDLYENYKNIANRYFPKSLVCADQFHVLKHLTEGFKQVRLRCRRSTEDENIEYLLTKFKYIFNHGTDLDNKTRYNKRLKRYINHRQIMELLFERFPDLKLAYELKEGYITFNTNSNINNAKEELAEQIKLFGESNLKEYVEFYNILINWNTEIINSFVIINGRRINNSYIESRNNNIEHLIYNAYGFTNFKRMRNRIMYCLNKDDTYKI